MSCRRTRGVHVEFDVTARMRDGVALRANVYRPDGVGPWPTLLRRLPYGKDTPQEVAWAGIDPVQAARQGFLVVIQDTRGRFQSDGDWKPFRFEGQDGYDSVEWAAKLPGSNGLVGMFGGSYDGNTQWLAALEHPPSLAAITPLMTWSDPMDGVFARGGAMELGLGLMWALLLGPDQVSRSAGDALSIETRVQAVLDDWDLLPHRGYWALPVNDPRLLHYHGIEDVGAIRALKSPDISSMCGIAGRQKLARVPSLHSGGWYDLFLQGTLDNYQAMAEMGYDCRLVVGPWTHPASTDPIGEQAFGIRAGRDGPACDQLGNWVDQQLGWLRERLTPETVAEPPGSPVRVFMMGRNEWRDMSSWPPKRVRPQRWFLCADGSLSPHMSESHESSSEFVYDPADPAPTVGGHTSMWPGYVPGPRDQRAVEARPDVLVFTSEPLRDDLEVTGRVRVLLQAASSASSTDWVARLCDVHPDGRSVNICDGIARVEHQANGCGCHEIDLWSTCNVFLRGHRLRVAVTSSSFPRWDRNLNTGRQDRARTGIAHQRVYHALPTASYVELPVMA